MPKLFSICMLSNASKLVYQQAYSRAGSAGVRACVRNWNCKPLECAQTSIFITYACLQRTNEDK